MSTTSAEFKQAADLATMLQGRVRQSVFGQQTLITEVLCALLAEGHILVTGAPGLAKTTLVRVLATHLGLDFGRVQFTPDLLPSDILGSDILNMDAATGKREFVFSPGPVFVHLLLADEINRASPRTQSALLEAMQERSATVGRSVHKLPKPFMVFATQNPLESEGTFPLPEAQLDRFLLHTLVAYPDEASELRILNEHAGGHLFGEKRADELLAPEARVSPEDINRLMAATKHVRIDEGLLKALLDLVRSTRPSDETCPAELRQHIVYGAGPRGGISLVSTCRALALLEGSDNVRWRHVRQLAKPVLRHRVRLSLEAVGEEWSEERLIDQLLERIESKYRDLVSGLA